MPGVPLVPLFAPLPAAAIIVGSSIAPGAPPLPALAPPLPASDFAPPLPAPVPPLPVGPAPAFEPAPPFCAAFGLSPSEPADDEHADPASDSTHPATNHTALGNIDFSIVGGTCEDAKSIAGNALPPQEDSNPRIAPKRPPCANK